MLKQLKQDFDNLVLDTNEEVDKIEKALDQKLPAYSKLSTEIDLNGLNESQQVILYKLKIDGLKTKLIHANDFLKAINDKNEYKINKLDLFNEIGHEPKED